MSKLLRERSVKVNNQIKCYSCKYFGITTCCDRAVCRQQMWDDHEYDPNIGNMDEFLIENSEGCTDYEKDET